VLDDFNPYHVWLGIPPDEQPANHYKLLGIRPFETSADVIDSAADRQMAHLRTFQGGKHGDLTQRLLNEVAAARVCLLDAKKRSDYDQRLRAKMPSSAAASVPGLTTVQPTTPIGPIRRPAAPLPAAAPTSPVADKWDDLLGESGATPLSTPGSKSAKLLKAAAAKRQTNSRLISVGIAAGLVLIGAIGFGVYSLTRSSDTSLVFDWSAADRYGAKVTVDDVPIAVPVTELWEHHCSVGPHHIVAERPGLKLDTTVTLAAGQRQNIPPDWKPKAVLVLNWRLADRGGATLKVDGQQRPVSQQEPLELGVEPGRHLIQITRAGAAPFSASAAVAADQREMVNVPRPQTEAKLVLDWPADQRKDAELTIDGLRPKAPAGSSGKPFELTLAPGRHSVRISRPGFEAFTQDVDLVAGPNLPLTPTWTSARPVTTPDVATALNPTETVTHPAKKFPVPTAAEQEQITKQLDEIYKLAKPDSNDSASAQHLYDVAATPGSSPAERYMLLTKGAEKAIAVGDVLLAMQGVDTLAADYDVDALELKQKLLDKFVNVGKPDQVAAAIPLAEQLMDQAAAADELEIAIVLGTTASRAVAKAQIAARKETEDRLALRRHNLRMMMPMFAAAKKAEESLVKDPADLEANLKLGRWRCLYKGDWASGLPLLAKSSDEKLKAIAQREQKAPADAEQQVELADAWWDLAKTEGGTARDSIHAHAADIYRAAMPNLTSALKKAALEKRLAEVASLKPRVAPAAASNSPGTAKPAEGVKFPIGEWVDVLRLVDTTRDAVEGTWIRTADGISCTTEILFARISIPITIDGSYDLEVEFTRDSGTHDVATIFSVGAHSSMFCLGAYGGKVSGLFDLNGRSADEPDFPVAVRPGILENNHRYRELLRVESISPNGARLDLSLDGKQYVPPWSGDPAGLTVRSNWGPARPGGLAIGGPGITFHSVRLRLKSGRASENLTVATPTGSRSAEPTESFAAKEYTAASGQQDPRLIHNDRGFCFLAGVSGWLGGYGEGSAIDLDKNGVWNLESHAKAGILATKAISIEPAAQNMFKSQIKRYQWRNGAAPVRMLRKDAGICLLVGVEGSFRGYAEGIGIQLHDDGFWYLQGKSGQAELGAKAIGVEWAAPGTYKANIAEQAWKVGDPPVKLLKKEEGFAVLSGITGNFVGLGEEVQISLADDGVWCLQGRSGQSELAAKATTITISKIGAAKPAKKSIAAGNYTINSKADGRFLAPSDNTNNPGTTTIAAREPSGDKVWVLESQPGGSFKLANSSGVVLGIRQDLKDAGVDAILWSWAGSDGQLWNVVPVNGDFVRIVNKNSGLCLSVRASDGTAIVQEPWANLPTQQWKLTPAR
jgi:hypothetical protein